MNYKVETWACYEPKQFADFLIANAEKYKCKITEVCHYEVNTGIDENLGVANIPEYTTSFFIEATIKNYNDLYFALKQSFLRNNQKPDSEINKSFYFWFKDFFNIKK